MRSSLVQSVINSVFNKLFFLNKVVYYMDDLNLTDEEFKAVGNHFKKENNVSLIYFKSDGSPAWIEIDKIRESKNFDNRYYKGVAL